MQPGLYFEDFPVGYTYETGARTVTESELTTFVGLSGMFEELFIDRTALKTTLFDRPFVPGVLTLMFAEGLNILSGAIRGTGLALMNLEFKSTAPVFVGDTIKGVVTVTAVKPTRSPERGVVTARHAVKNQNGETVMEYTAVRMIRCRPRDGESG